MLFYGKKCLQMRKIKEVIDIEMHSYFYNCILLRRRNQKKKDDDALQEIIFNDMEWMELNSAYHTIHQHIDLSKLEIKNHIFHFTPSPSPPLRNKVWEIQYIPVHTHLEAQTQSIWQTVAPPRFTLASSVPGDMCMFQIQSPYCTHTPTFISKGVYL